MRFIMTFMQILMTLMTLPCQVCPTIPNARQAALDQSLGCLQVSRFVHTTQAHKQAPPLTHTQAPTCTKEHTHSHTNTCTAYQQTYTKICTESLVVPISMSFYGQNPQSSWLQGIQSEFLVINYILPNMRSVCACGYWLNHTTPCSEH